MKVDLVMWTKNGEATLNEVFRRINQEIPEENVNQRFIVDDESTDRTRQIAKFNGWEVYLNKGRGISDGANTALNIVETNYFCSFEQDVLLAEGWWRKAILMLQVSDVVSGIRLTNILGFNEIEKYGFLHKNNKFSYKTLDNTIYNTWVIREVGGFPNVKTSGVDTALLQKILESGYKWNQIDSVSRHIRKCFWDVMRHAKWYGKNHSVPKMLLKFLYSPIQAIIITVNQRCLRCLIYYPLLRLSFLLGAIEAKVKT